jgi:hypothetical protein
VNLHGIVSGAIGAVNPFITGTVRYSTGSTTQPSGKRTPAYNDVTGVSLQVQALTFRDLQQLEGLNLNGTRRAIYLFGAADGVVRPTSKGGDLIVITGGVQAGTWLVAQVLEQWGDGGVASWVKVAVTLQND